ncbi:MAG: hypothetical protein H6839_14210 [Planctomycetes bacterium]|nr:hypothetical protein [Planctomycetota bacterium]
MYPTPKHLRAIVKPRQLDDSEADETSFAGDLRCPCGGDEFLLLHAGGVLGKGKLKDVGYADVNGQHFLIVKVRCTKCDAEHTVFDDDYHGWNGYVCAPEEGLRDRPRPPLTPWECSNCGCMAHRAVVFLIGESREHALSEGEGVLTDDDWFEAFGAIVMDIECVTCEFKRGGWLNHETM